LAIQTSLTKKRLEHEIPRELIGCILLAAEDWDSEKLKKSMGHLVQEHIHKRADDDGDEQVAWAWHPVRVNHRPIV
jgi:hypothetical protein